MTRPAILCKHGVLGKSKCRQCQNEWSSVYYHRHPKKCEQANKKWRETHKEQYRESRKKRDKKYREIHPSKKTSKQWRAQAYVQRHPELLYPECEFCGTVENLQGHHPTYDYPEIVVTACARCHYYVHLGVG